MMTACLLVLESQSREKKSFLPRGLMGAVMSEIRMALCKALDPVFLSCGVSCHSEVYLGLC